MEKETLNRLNQVLEKEGMGSSEYSTLDLFSSSNFTMTSSEGGHEPSTSGCSSFVVSQSAKEKKKRVKDFLKEIKSMVPTRPGGGRKMGTLHALQHALSSLKKTKYGKQKSKGRHANEMQELSPFEYESDSQISMSADSLKSSDEMRIILSASDLLVMTVSSNLKYILGYPEDSWRSRNMSHFIHKRDIVTFSRVNHETNFSGKSDSVQSKVFYFRLRKFKGLGSGFSLRKQDSFVPFQCILIKKMLDKEEIKKKVDYTSSSSEGMASMSHSDLSSFQTESTAQYIKQETQVSLKGTSKKLCTTIHCVPLMSLYSRDGKLPHVRTFEIRHTLFCSYCHVHPNMISLLGYLPQEVLGASIFDFYHPDDLDTLFNIYKTVISMKENERPYKGSPIRLRAKNGDWVKVVSDWSSFANPWSKQIEFILAKHTVIGAPENPDLFSESQDIQRLEDLPDSVIEAHQRIKDLLLQPVETTYVRNNESIVPTTTGQTWLQKANINDKVRAVKDSPIPATPLETQPDSEKMMYKPQMETGVLYKDSSINNQYEQLNYSNGIKKFLLSQPRTFSRESSTKISSSEEEDLQETMVHDFDISVPKPPSVGSSTKVLVSEQEREDRFTIPPATRGHSLFDPTPLHLGHPILSMPPVPHVPVQTPSKEMPEVMPLISRPLACPEQVVSLTRESLWKHTLIQERLFVANSSPERSLLFLDKPQDHSLQRQTLKRSHQEAKSGRDTSSGLKSRRVLEGVVPSSVSILNQALPLSRTIDGHFSLMRQQQLAGHEVPMMCANPQAEDYNVMAPAQMVPFLSLSKGGVPLTSTSASVAADGCQMSVQTGNNKAQGSFFPVSGEGVSSQMVVGYNQAGILQAIQPDGTYVPIAIQDLNNIQSQQQGAIVNLADIGRSKLDKEDKKSERQSMGTPSLSSMEETSSSMYFLETGSNTVMEINNADLHNLTSQLYTTTWVQPAPWLRNCCFSAAVEMRYRMPKVKRQTQLKKDSEEILHHTQPGAVFDQINELMDSMEINGVQFFDEESDDLIFPPEDDEILEAKQRPCKCAQINNCNQWQSHDHGISKAIPKLRQNLKKEKRKGMTSVSKQSDFSRAIKEEEDESDSWFMPTSRNWGDMQGVSLENGSQKQDSSNEDTERPVSFNSALTPSDQRSNNENGSSMKESDGDAMSKQSDSSKDNSVSLVSECETKGSNFDTMFEKLFRSVSICFPHLHKELSPWVKTSDFNEKISLMYRKLDSDVEQILNSDLCKLQQFVQPELVSKQLKESLEDVDSSDNANHIFKDLMEVDSLSEEQDNQNVTIEVKKVHDSLTESAEMNLDNFGKLFCDVI